MKLEIQPGQEAEQPVRRVHRPARRSFVERWLGLLGRGVESMLRQAGEVSQIFWGSFVAFLRGQVPARAVLREMYWMGVESIPIILFTAVVIGIVSSQQGGYQFTGGVPLYYLGSVVTSTIILELGPVLTAIVFIGRVGARITAELGTMKVSEQIDALHSLGRPPIRTLAAPRLLAGFLTLPLLVALCNTVGIGAGMFTARATLGLGFESFLYGARVFWHTFDIYYSVGKGAVFGFIIPLVAVHMGLRTHGGAEGVGRSTTAAVVAMLMAMLVLDAVFPMIFLR